MKNLKSKLVLVVLVVTMMLSSGCSDSSSNRSAAGKQFTSQSNAVVGLMNTAYDAVH